MKRRFLDLAVAASVLGLMQALVGTFLVAWLYRDLLLAPYRFFPTHSYDAFTKLFFVGVDRGVLPSLLDGFVAQGAVAKLAIAPQLVAINLSVAIVLSLLLAPVAGLFGVGREVRPLRALALVVAVCIVVHLAVWALAFHMPEAATASNVLRAAARDVLQGGLGVALGVLAVATGLAAAILAKQSVTRLSLASGVAAALLCAAGVVPDATARIPAPEREAAAPAPAAGYNVILISIDSLRADHLGAYGYGRATSPAIDDLAKNGVLFRHSSSTTSWTLPAHMSLLTGRSLLGHGVVADDRSLSASVPTLAESFQKAGYQTHAIVSAPYLHSRFGFARGFDDYDDHTIFFATNEDSYRSVTAPQLFGAATEFLEAHGDKPFFLFLHAWDVHYDYAPGTPYDRMFDPDYTGKVDGNNFYFDPAINRNMDPRDLEHLVALYDGEIRLVDDHIARLRSELDKLGIAGRTIVTVVGDHGDEFFEHGNKGHHRTLYEEVLHTPFVLSVPGLAPKQAVVEAEASIIDVAPTLAGLAGAAPIDGAEGRDWSGLYGSGSLPEPGPVFAELYRTGTRNVQAAEISERRKVIHHFQRRWLQSYDLAEDPAEKHSLPPAGPLAAPLVSRLGDWLDARWHRFDKRVRKEGIAPVILDAKTKEQLRSLGYLQ